MRLGCWVAGPLVGLIVVFELAVNLAPVECGQGGGANDLEMTAFLAVTALATLAVAIAAVVRLVALRLRASTTDFLRRVLLPGALALLATVLAAVVVLDDDHFAYVAVVAGVALAAVSFLALLVACAAGRSVDSVGVVLPLYLIGAGCCYFTIVLFAFIEQVGFGC